MNQAVYCYFSQIEEQTPKSLTDTLQRRGNTHIRDTRVVFQNSTLTITTKGGQEFLCNATLPVVDLFPLEDGLIIKCKFKSGQAHIADETQNSDYCYMTLTGHPLNDLHPLSMDNTQQIASKASLIWVGTTIPFVVLCDLDSVNFCLVCRQNQAQDMFAYIKPDSRNRQLNFLSSNSQIELRTIYQFSLSQKTLLKVVVTRGLVENTFCVNLLTSQNNVLVFESDLMLKFQLKATYENIKCISEINFVSFDDSAAQLISSDLVNQLADQNVQSLNTAETRYFKNCIKNLMDQVVMLDLQNKALQVFIGGYYHIHSAEHAKVTGMSAAPTSIQLLKDGRLEITYEGGRKISLFFQLRLPCIVVRSITSAFRRLLPGQDFTNYLTRLINIFESKAGPMFTVYARQFLYLIGVSCSAEVQKPQQHATAFERLLKIQQKHQEPVQQVRLDSKSASKLQEINKILQLLLEDLKLERSIAIGAEPLQDLISSFQSQILTQNSSESATFDFQYWCQNMNTVFPILFERTRVVCRIYEVINQKGSFSYFALPSLPQSNVAQVFAYLNVVEAKSLEQQYLCESLNEYYMTNQKSYHVFERALAVLSQENFSNDRIQMLPYQVQLPIHEILTYTRSHIEEIKTFEWPSNFYVLIKREDILNNMKQYTQLSPKTATQINQAPTFSLSHQLSFKKEVKNAKQQLSSETFVQNLIGAQIDHQSENSGFRFTGLSGTVKDSRFQEVDFLLRSDVPMKIKESQLAGELNEEQFMANQKLILDKMFRRQLSKFIGRGAVQLGTEETLPTEKLDIPPITASAVVQKPQIQNLDSNPQNQPVTIAVDLKSKEEKEMMQWPDFHNGVAAALRIQRESFCLNPAKSSRNWIMYHRPVVPKNEHGGFLLGLGLLGQLDQLQPTDLYQHLKIAHESTTIGILLGRAASKLGQMDESDSRMMCLHIPALLPPNLSVEYSLSVQSAAVIASGLLYMSTSCRAISEMLLSQIAKKPNTDKLVEREGYSFSAGLALGLVNLAAGSPNESMQTQLLSELELEERLVRFVQGGKPLPLPRSMLSQIQLNENAKSSAVKETDQINTHVTAPGALAALALIYLKSNNMSIAKRIEVPQSFVALDKVTPQNLVLRVIARNLILWDCVENTQTWITTQIPDFIKLVFESSNQNQLNRELKYKISEKEIDFAAISQSYANIKAASVLSMGIKFAGTNDKTAKQTVLNEINWFRKKVQAIVAIQPLGGPIQTNQSFATKNQIDKNTVDKCLCMCALAIGMIMAGSCDVESFKICRILRKRFETEMNFGYNQAICQAMGMIFLGQGQYTFSKTNKAIAGLFCSVYPVFPQHPGDNRFYLQALRHFYVLALETRLLQAKDIDTGNFVRVQVQVETLLNGKLHTNVLSTPEIVNGQIQSLTVKNDEFYHDLSLQVAGQGMLVDQQNGQITGDFQKSDLQQIVYVKSKNFMSDVKKVEPVTESLQSILKVDNDESKQQLFKAATNSLEGLREVSDPLVQAFFSTFAQQRDATQALSSIMLESRSDFFAVLEQVEQKIFSFSSQSIQHNLVQLYQAYLTDKVDSLPILLSNLKQQLVSKGIVSEPVIEKQQPVSNSQTRLAIAILNELIQGGEQSVVKQYLKAVLQAEPLTDVQLEIHNALQMCGVCAADIKEIAANYSS